VKSFVFIALALVAAPAFAQATPVELTAPGPEGPLAGTLIDPDPKVPLVVLIPGSGPTDRDGNNPKGVAGAPFRQLAEALAAKGVATLRADKRGMFGSKGRSPTSMLRPPAAMPTTLMPGQMC
jgi:hypothetical protein